MNYDSAKSRVKEWQKEMYDLTFAYPFPSTIGDRVLSNNYTAKWHGHDEDVIAHREQVSAATKDGDVHHAAVRAGSAVGLIDSIESAGTIVRRTVSEAESILRERPAQLLQ